MIVVDVETTGTDPQNHSIISIGALDFSNPENQFYGECRPWKGAKINKQALKINGFTEPEIKSKPKDLKQLITEFSGWSKKISNKVLAGENIWFDVSFLKESFGRVNQKWTFGRRFIDLHTYSYISHILNGKLSQQEISKLSLDKTLNYVGLPREPKPHHALRGAKLEAEALSRLMFGENLLKQFHHYSIPEYLKK